MKGLIQCIYSSAATEEFEEFNISPFLEKTRASNAKLGLTGMLLYVEGSFFQVLEGRRDVVEALLKTIESDTRHKRVNVIVCEPIQERSFGEWTMGYESLGLADVADIVGENDFFDAASCIEKMTASGVKKLLLSFRKGEWHDRTGIHRVDLPAVP
jgi:hypothetical protein